MSIRQRPRHLPSYGIKDAYKYFLENKKDDCSFLSLNNFCKIMNVCNKAMSDIFIEEGTLQLPYHIGQLNLYRYKQEPYIDKEGKVQYRGIVNWKETNKLWDEYPELRKIQFVKYIRPYSFKVVFDPRFGNLRNRSLWKMATAKRLTIESDANGTPYIDIKSRKL